MEEKFVNETGVVVGGLSIGELITVVENMDDCGLRRKFLQLLAAMYESNIDSLVLSYPPVRGKQ